MTYEYRESNKQNKDTHTQTLHKEICKNKQAMISLQEMADFDVYHVDIKTESHLFIINKNF